MFTIASKNPNVIKSQSSLDQQKQSYTFSVAFILLYMVHDIPITFYRVGVLGSMYGQYSGL